MTTITRLKQLKDWMGGKMIPERVQRQSQAWEQLQADLAAIREQHELLKATAVAPPTRLESYRDKIVPNLRQNGYAYFLACDSKDYQQHQEWCHDNCEDHTLPHCDVWQFDAFYPRAFASQADAALFRLNFEAHNIGGDE